MQKALGNLILFCEKCRRVINKSAGQCSCLLCHKCVEYDFEGSCELCKFRAKLYLNKKSLKKIYSVKHINVKCPRCRQVILEGLKESKLIPF